MILFFLLAGLFIILGIAVRFGKASWLIAGFNTSPEFEKEKYDEDALCTFIGRLMFVLGAIWLFVGLANIFFSSIFTILLMVGVFLFIGVIVAAVFYMNTGNRFKKK